MNDTQILQQAISAIKNGDKATGQKLLLPFLKANPKHEIALLWLSATTDDIDKKQQCFERVLIINPDNEVAKRGLAELQKQVRQSQQIEVPEVEISSQQVGPLPKAGTISSMQPSQAVNLQPIDKSEVKEQGETTLELPPKKSVSTEPLKAIKQEATKKCPYCAEVIKAEAIVCRYCGRDLNTSSGQITPPQVVHERSSQSCVGGLGLLILVIGILSSILFSNQNSTIIVLIVIALIFVGAMILAIALFSGKIKFLG